MVRFKSWQWAILALPLVSIVGFLLVAAGWQIQHWGLSWIWAIFIVALLGWRWLLARWTKPQLAQLEAAVADANQQLEASRNRAEQHGNNPEAAQAVRDALQEILQETQQDPPFWEDWACFWQRGQAVVVAVARAYNPDVKYPLLSIYVPQAYGLIRGTVDDLDRWMEQLSPVLGQVTVGQAYQAYEVYQKLEPSARKLRQVWGWAQWLFNPAVAAARQVTQKSSSQATQELLGNLGQLLREAALRNLAQQAIYLYSGEMSQESLPNLTQEEESGAKRFGQTETETLANILDRAESAETIEKKPVNLLLVGRTGAGKSSVINTLFDSDRAAVDVLPSTDKLCRYVWEAPSGDSLVLWDTPGYEQANRQDYRALVLERAQEADLVLLVTPALDPALQMDEDFLRELQKEVSDLPAMAIVTQVDRLRPLREWSPPYDWEGGDRPKEQSIRHATEYRQQELGHLCRAVLPLVTRDERAQREAWNLHQLSNSVVASLDPAKQLRLTRFLRDRKTRIRGAAQIIERYSRQMATTQGLTNFLKSPILQFISTLTTGQPTLAYLLAEQIPVEQLPIVIGKLQIAYDLFSLLTKDDDIRKFDLLSLWSILLDNPSPPERNAWAFGHAVTEYWVEKLSTEQLQKRFKEYFEEYGNRE
ncbi:50S ribosome-binding GTPase [Phormidium yuhuli AB48]|uniref:50S ribosome-binding GTPase n=1 Tax=Phormidium yuhuli AB48 TaxID=2940671 RepID=A0ABY5ALU3_9CYAN|nr:GTPase [Phormidium yuhuli]USR89721.1 50S ribosome-binding GTPase [Phormidium yuhuli AB48]